MNLSLLDKTFSLFTRQRDAVNGIVKCISCGKLIPWKESDNGHYINRKHMATRYDEQNNNSQCRSCNRFDEGNIQGYRKGLIEKIGVEAVERLEIKKFNTCKMSQFEVNMLTKYYKEKIKILTLNQ